ATGAAATRVRGRRHAAPSPVGRRSVLAVPRLERGAVRSPAHAPRRPPGAWSGRLSRRRCPARTARDARRRRRPRGPPIRQRADANPTPDAIAGRRTRRTITMYVMPVTVVITAVTVERIFPASAA